MLSKAGMRFEKLHRVAFLFILPLSFELGERGQESRVETDIATAGPLVALRLVRLSLQYLLRKSFLTLSLGTTACRAGRIGLREIQRSRQTRDCVVCALVGYTICRHK